MKEKKLTYKGVFRFIFTAFVTFILGSLQGSSPFMALSFYIAVIYSGMYPLVALLALAAGTLPDFSLASFISLSAAGAIAAFIFFLYGRKNKKPAGEIIAYSAVIFTLFCYFAESGTLPVKLIKAGVGTLLVPVFISAARLIYVKKLDYKASFDEILSLAVFGVAFSLGIGNVFGANVLKSFIIFLSLVISAGFGSGAGEIAAVILSVSAAAFSKSLTPLAVYPALILLPSAFMKKSKLIACFSLIAADLACMLVLKVYDSFVYTDVFYVVAPIALFLFIPEKFNEYIRKRVAAFSGKVLPRYAVNRMRSAISSKLYGVSDVFGEMEKSFTALKECVSTDDELLGKMADEVTLNVCDKCPSKLRCRQKSKPDRDDLIKILSVGLAKNRVSLIDLTKSFAENCGYVNGVIYEMNAAIGKYREKVKESEESLSGKELVRMQSEGVSGVLKGMALEFSKNLSYFQHKEKKLGDALRKKGVLFSEIMILGSEEDPEIDLVIKNEDMFNRGLIEATDAFCGKKTAITARTSISSTVSAITVRPAPALDAAFGLATSVKNGSLSSGDTHSLLKIDEGRFLVAVSDGMGSGVRAQSTSSTAISLIESFYKAGLKSDLILGMVNKVLAISTEENFSAMDVLTINLFDMSADFIKIGAPYSFILSDNSIKIIEGSSLPLGILDDLSPTGCTAALPEGSTVIMLTDGISDAFGSSTDMIDFLRTLDNRNPQLIADSILKKALNEEGGEGKDDMTVLCVRIFKKAS